MFIHVLLQTYFIVCPEQHIYTVKKNATIIFMVLLATSFDFFVWLPFLLVFGYGSKISRKIINGRIYSEYVNLMVICFQCT